MRSAIPADSLGMITLVALITAGGPVAGAENLILNGDFEETSLAQCLGNLSNFEFGLYMPHAAAFGRSEQIDIMIGPTGCDFLGPAESGEVKIGISSDLDPPRTDAFSFELSAPVETGKTYTVSFHAWQWGRTFAPDIGPVRIGLSNDPHSFGTEIYRATPGTSGWNHLRWTFRARGDSDYLTVEAASAGDTWIHIDNFSLVEGTAATIEAVSWGTLKAACRR
jgi:hypothetical protein